MSGAGIMTARTPIIEIQEVDSCKELLAIEGLSSTLTPQEEATVARHVIIIYRCFAKC